MYFFSEIFSLSTLSIEILGVWYGRTDTQVFSVECIGGDKEKMKNFCKSDPKISKTEREKNATKNILK
jgi:hypothetical protein